MTLVEAFARLEALGQSLFETKDVAALLGVENSNANKIVSRLARDGLILSIARGKWALRNRLNKLAIAENLTSPYPVVCLAANRSLSSWHDFADPGSDVCHIPRPGEAV